MSDAERFDALYREHYAAVVRFTRRRTTAAATDDVVADTFAIAWRRIRDVPPDPLPWLYVVARNLLYAERRANAADQERLDHLTRQRDPTDDDLGDVIADQDIAVTAFGRLSVADREVLSLVAWEHLEHAVAAKVLGITRVAFSMRLSRARRRLTTLIAELEEPTSRQTVSSQIAGDPR